TMTADLRVFILGNPSSEVGPGGTLTYTLFVRNFGDTTATGIEVENSLPPGFNVANRIPGGNFIDDGVSPEGVVTFSGGTLAPNESAILTIVGTAPQNATGSIENVVVVDPPIASGGAVNEGTNENNNTATLVTTIDPALGPDLRIFKLDSPDPVAPGDPITYTLLVRNDGQATATDITVRDSLPDGFTVMSNDVIPGGNFTTTGIADENNAITFSGGTLGIGESAILTIVGTTEITAGDIEVANIAVVDPDNAITEANEDNNIVTTTTTLDTDLLPDLIVTTLSNPTTVAPGGTLTYTILVRNNGPKDISDDTPIVVRDTLDANFSVFAGTNGVIPGGNFQETSRDNNVITFTGNGLASGESAILTITGTVANLETATLVNTVVVDPSDINNVVEGGPEDNNTFVNNTTISVSEGPDLGIFLLSNPTTVRPGETVTYTLLVRNDGPGGASGIEVRDELPSGFNFIDAIPGGDFEVGTETDDLVTFTGGSLASGDSAILTIVGTVSADVSGNLINTAIVDPDGDILETGQGDNNNTEMLTTTVGLPDLTIFKSGNPSGTLQAGDTLTYTITVRNDGDAATPENSIVVQDALPSNFIYMDAITGGDFTLEPVVNNTVTFTGGTLDTGESAILTIVGLANAAGATAEVTNTAVVDPGNDIAERNANGNAETNNSGSFTVNVEPPSRVFVDDDWANLNIGDDVDPDGDPGTEFAMGDGVFGINAFPTIGEGVTAVKTDNADPGVVQVFAGTYGEIVGIGKPVSLIGPQAGVAGDNASRAPANEAIITGAAVGIGLLDGASAGQVIIDGFRLEGAGPGAGAAIDTSNGGPNTTIRNNVITGSNNDAIRNFPKDNPLFADVSNLVIENNLIENISNPNGSSRGMILQEVNGLTVTGNVVRDITVGDNPGILLDTVTGNVLVQGNTLTNIASQGIQVAGIGAGGTVTITENVLDNINTRNDPTNSGIRLRNSPFGAELGAGTVVVTTNRIENTLNGLYVRDAEVDVSNVTVSGNFFVNITDAARTIVNLGSGTLDAPGGLAGLGANFEDLAGLDPLDSATNMSGTDTANNVTGSVNVSFLP
ncbi:MAG: CARDB domain-containing protein, partial [Hormoscilla sp.]